MKKRIVLALVLGTVLSLVIGSSAALAHGGTHIHQPNGECVNVTGPHGNNDKAQYANAAHHPVGLTKARGMDQTPLDSGWCDHDA